jgi:hypothetical protein
MAGEMIQRLIFIFCIHSIAAQEFPTALCLEDLVAGFCG